MCAILAVWPSHGCDAPPQPPAPAAPASATPAPQVVQPQVNAQEQGITPSVGARLLGEYHRRRDYDRLSALIHEDHRAATLSFLRAVDAVIDANARMREVAIARFGRVLADSWNLSAIENNLGVFSADTQILTQRFRGDEAEVTLQEGEQVPLVRARFLRVGGDWKFVPDAVSADIEPTLLRLGGELRGIASRLNAGADYIEYLKAFPERIAPLIDCVAPSEETIQSATVDADSVSP